MQYSDVISQFDEIQHVDINFNGCEIVVHGTADSGYYKHIEKFNSKAKGNMFAEKVQKLIKK